MVIFRFAVYASIVFYGTQRFILCKKDDENGCLTNKENVASAYFLRHENRVLEVERLASFLVNSFTFECAQRCLRHESCLSFNLKTQNGTRFLCELLPADMYNASERFQLSGECDHYSIFTPCLNFPCRNGGTCVPDYHRGLFVCLCPFGYEGTSCEHVSELGSSATNPGLSCKEIADSRKNHSLGDGEYWIDPSKSGNPFTAYCDMKTDGGGWTLLRRAAIPENYIREREVKSENYTSISEYSNIAMVTINKAIEELRQLINLRQLRWYCFKKSRGRVYHVMTHNDTAGQHVLDYFLKNFGTPVSACDSYTRLPDDNSTLSQNCDKWGPGGDETGIMINRWGTPHTRGRNRLYRNVSMWVDGGNWFSIYFKLFLCDDDGAKDVSAGDLWEVYAR